MPEYEDYHKMITAQVWRKLTQRPDLDYDELLSAGHLAFCIARNSWNAAKGAFSTQLFYQLRHQLNKVHTKKRREIPLERLVGIQHSQTEGGGFFAAAVSQLSDEAKQVVNLIFGSGNELVDLTQKHIRTSKSGIQSYLSSIGWREAAITATFQEIRTMLSQ